MESGRIATLSRNEILEKGDLHVANLVGVTNPVPNYDASNNNRTLPAAPKPSDTRIQNIPDPSRVGRPDARTDQQGANDALNSGVLRYDSNLQFFLQQMRDMPELGAELSKMVTLMQGLVTTPGLAAGVTEELSGFLELLKIGPRCVPTVFSDADGGGQPICRAPLLPAEGGLSKDARRYRAGGNSELCQTLQ